MSASVRSPRPGPSLNLDTALLVRGLSLEAFAGQCGVSKETLSRIRRGHPIRPGTAAKIGRALRSIPAILPDEVEVTPAVRGGSGDA